MDPLDVPIDPIMLSLPTETTNIYTGVPPEMVPSGSATSSAPVSTVTTMALPPFVASGVSSSSSSDDAPSSPSRADTRKAKAKKPSATHRKSRFSEEEDAELARLVTEIQAPLTCSDWSRIGEAIGKTPKQCRERWSNVLDPSLVNLRNKWTEEELDLLFQAQRIVGSKWSRIASLYFKGRPENAVKNAYYAALRRADRRRRLISTDSATTAAALSLSELAFSPVVDPNQPRDSSAPSSVGKGEGRKRLADDAAFAVDVAPAEAGGSSASRRRRGM